MKAQDLVVGDLFTYVGAFAVYRVETTPEELSDYLGKVVFEATRLAPPGSLVLTRLDAEHDVVLLGHNVSDWGRP